MRVYFDEETGITQLSFAREDIEDAKRLLQYAIEGYRQQGYDVSPAEQVLSQMDQTNTTTH